MPSRLSYFPAIFGFALATAYCPFITGAAASPRWGVLVVGAVVFLLTTKRVRWHMAPVVWGSIFLGWALLSLIWAGNFERIDLAWKFCLLGALFIAGGQLPDLKPIYAGAAAGLAVSAVLVGLDLADLIHYQQASRPSGLFVNSVYLGEFSAMVIAGLLGHGMVEWAIWGAAPALILLSVMPSYTPRGALVALAVAGLIPVIKRLDLRALVALVVLAIGIPLAIWLRPATIIDRLEMWGDLVRHLNLLGHGLGAYFADAPFISEMVDASINRKLHAQNDLLEIGYDLGAVGVISAVGFVVSLLARGPLSAEKFVIIVFMVEGAFGFGFYLPWSVGLFCLAAGSLARRSFRRVPSPVAGGGSIRKVGVVEGYPSAARLGAGSGGTVPVRFHVPDGAGHATVFDGSKVSGVRGPGDGGTPRGG